MTGARHPGKKQTTKKQPNSHCQQNTDGPV